MADSAGLIPNETQIPCRTLVACLCHTEEAGDAVRVTGCALGGTIRRSQLILLV